jgi:hypothetical protein
MGRWTFPDWSAVPSQVPFADLSDPQSLNLYRYGANNPLRSRDLDGHTHQECDADNWANDSKGVPTLTSGACYDMPDWWNFPGRWAYQAASTTWGNTQQASHNTVKFASSPRGKLLGKSLKHLTIGGLKGTTAVGGVALAPETFGASLGLTAYAVVGATGDLTAGTAELLGTIFGSDSDLE